MARPTVFISYRRDDAAGYARALHEALVQDLGPGRVFMDVADIGAGESFARVIDAALAEASVLLVLIGPRWRGERPGGGPARLDEPGDFVHLEVACGLAQAQTRGLRVIPVLLDGQPMPGAAQLPPALAGLAQRHALPLSHARYEADLAALRQAVLGPAPASRRRAGWALLALPVVAAAGAGAWWATRAAPRPPINGEWQADVTYDWPGARHTERLRFSGEGTALQGQASFLRVPRAIADGRIEADGRVTFSTRTQEVSGERTRELSHRFSGRLVGDVLQLTLQIEGSEQPHAPVRVEARRVPGG